MMADLPHTLYLSSKDGKKVTQDAIDDAEAKTREAYEKRMKRQSEQSYTIEEVFAGAADK